jgi:vacuolar-type H+-ATPase subunit E/Vma4
MTAAAGALGPMVELELRGAAAEADKIRAGADRRVAELLAQAHAEAAALIARRRSDAEQLAELEQRDRLAEARAEARGTVLRAQRAVLHDVRAAAHAAARELAGDQRLSRLFERLAADARDRIAGPVPVQIVEDPDGGFVARAGSREVDYSLRAQVDRVVDAMASELETLWR